MTQLELSTAELFRRYLIPLSQLLEILKRFAYLKGRPVPRTQLLHSVYDPLQLLFLSMLRSEGATPAARKNQQQVLQGLVTALVSGCSAQPGKQRYQAELAHVLTAAFQGKPSTTSFAWDSALTDLTRSPAWSALQAYLNEVGATGDSRHRWIATALNGLPLEMASLFRLGLRSFARNTPLDTLGEYLPWLALPPGESFPGRCPPGLARAQLCWEHLDAAASSAAILPEAASTAVSEDALVPVGVSVEVAVDTRLLTVTARAMPALKLSTMDAATLKALAKPWPRELTNLAKTQTQAWAGVQVQALPETLAIAAEWQRVASDPNALQTAIRAEQLAQQKKRLLAQHVTPLNAADRALLLELLQAQLNPTQKAPK